MKLKITMLALLAMIISFTSCDLTTTPEIEGVVLQEVAGSWWTTYHLPDGTQITNFSELTTANTAADNSSEMIIYDEDVLEFNCKASINLDALTFSTTSSANSLYKNDVDAAASSPFLNIGDTILAEGSKPITMDIEGQIFKDAFTAPSTTVTDSIAYTATGYYQTDLYKVVGYKTDWSHYDTIFSGVDTTLVDVFDTLEYKVEFLSGSSAADGPYILQGYRRTGFLEDEH